VVAAIGIIVPTHRFKENFEHYRDTVINTAVGISAAMGGPNVLITAARRGNPSS
jgi:hypothetical protein